MLAAKEFFVVDAICLVGEPKFTFVRAAVDLAQLGRDPSEHLAAFGFGRLIFVLWRHVMQADHFENFFPTNDVLSYLRSRGYWFSCIYENRIFW